MSVAPSSNLSALAAAALGLALAAAPLRAQQPTPEATFPPDGWQVQTGPTELRPGPGATPRLERGDDGRCSVRFQRPAGYAETVVTDGDGAVLARGDGDRLPLGALEIGARVVVYAADPAGRRCRAVLSDFVRFPGTVVPGKQWRPLDDARLPLRDVAQHVPKTRAEARDQPHRITFAVADARAPVVYVLARVVAGGKDLVAAQSLEPTLPFWFRARKGESFRIYELHPKTRTYRAGEVMAVAADYPHDRR